MNLRFDKIKIGIHNLKYFLILWCTQSFSALGSAAVNFALIILVYQKSGSALQTSLLTICSYAPYVCMSIFSGALCDKWDKKKTMLLCDAGAALCSAAIFILFSTGTLEIWHIYCLNAINGLMNTVQQPCADVATSLLTPKKYYQRVSGMRSLSNSLTTVLTPVIAVALFSFSGLFGVIVFDLITFAIAFISLLFFIKLPKKAEASEKTETLIHSAGAGLLYLKKNRGILDLILFLAAINLVASMYNAALPALILSKSGGNEVPLGIVNTVTGISALLGSILVSLLPAPKSRIKLICAALLFSMSTENFFLAFGKSLPVWCIGAALGWILIPFMNANMDVILRQHIPVDMQGRVYSARNSLQFFTIPIGYFLGGFLVDKVFEPIMSTKSGSVLNLLFGDGAGSGAAFLFLFLAVCGMLVCIVFSKDKYFRELE